MRAVPIITLTVLLTAGCALLEPLGMAPETRIEAHTEAGEYGRALALLDRQLAIKPDDAGLRRQRKEIAAQAARFEQDILIEAAEHLRQDNWAAARQSYQHGLSILPDSQALTAARDAYESQRESHLGDLGTRLLLARAHGLVSERPLIDAIHRASPDSLRSRQQQRRTEQEARELADRLMNLGETALGRDDPLLAVEALTLAHALAPAQVSAERLEAAQQARQSRLAALRTRPRTDDTGSNEPDQNEILMSRFQTAFQQDDLLLARQQLEALEARQPGDEGLRPQRQMLNQAIDTRVSAGLEEGRRLYAVGQIHEALEIWRPLKALAPEHRELEAHVERAERVLRRMETLQ
ncbi:hypothetical protein Tgr7_0671 [Thioalkalivibrio sulfidiphilus HL-EbGr7]|uniref:Tetratricopeptide repeat protein n=1 Tax=Thioalkalivibrio sulfidiphilus (strain HL-EbGR7) TaxID=396588 RepID=B8GMD1_THISH|nr:hypothetical protein [Thioalkalivibrio sulfidiphilus]ACL71763.1 hypothetical protein Tgr7_0671 [Thioalkalivibrio sulfidiphilus HL-EbGr7]